MPKGRGSGKSPRKRKPTITEKKQRGVPLTPRERVADLCGAHSVEELEDSLRKVRGSR